MQAYEDVKTWLGNNNDISINIWEKKYRQNDENFEEWLERVSGGDEDIKKVILEKKFLFGGRILSNRGIAGKGIKSTMSNCYVIKPPEDNLESIFEAAKKLARTYSYGGGCGIDISRLAPRGSMVHNTAKESSGAVSFMDLYSLVTGLIGQNGRRGALMISISCDHPDLEEFIDIKTDLNRVTKANISIRITDEFMKAVMNKEKFLLSFTRKETGETIEKEVNAYDIFHKLCLNNWRMGEPGMLFWNNIERGSLLSTDENFSYAGVNPCAEEPLPAGGSCLLGSINLSAFVTEDGSFDYDALSDTVRIVTKGMNDVLDEGLPLHGLEEQRVSVGQWRQIGIGMMGLADALIRMGIRYGSDQALEVSDRIGYVMANSALKASALLAKEYGAYPCYSDKIMESEFFKNNADDELIDLVSNYGLRNSQVLTVAPCGSISSMLGVSGGIEPIYANSYTMKTESLHKEGDVSYKMYTPIVKEYMENHGIETEEELPDYFVTAHSIDYYERIAMQASWQRHIDASISSTINLPNATTVEEIEMIYLRAWESGLKGVTVFRDGCEREGVLSTGNKDADLPSDNEADLPRGKVIKVNDQLIGKKRILQTGCGSLHCLAYFHPVTGHMNEVFLSKGSTGGCNNFMVGLSRMISLSLRGGISIEDVVDQLKSSGTCPSYSVRSAMHHDTSKGSCCPVAVGIALLEMNEEMKAEIRERGSKTEAPQPETVKEPVKIIPKKDSNDIREFDGYHCPECGELLAHTGRCVQCLNCSWYKCGD